MKKKIYANNLFFYIIGTVVIGIVCLAIAIGMLSVQASKETFLDVFAESQEKIFDQIDSEFYQFYSDMAEVTVQIANDSSVEHYLWGTFENSIQERQCILDVRQTIEESSIDNYPDCNILIVGKSGRTMVYKGYDRIDGNIGEILLSKVSLDAMDNEGSLVIQRLEQGFTDITKATSMITLARTIGKDGIVYVTIPETKFEEMYSYFTSNTSDILILNQNQEIISTNNPMYYEEACFMEIQNIMQKMKTQDLSHLTVRDGTDLVSYQMQRFQNTSYSILGIVNPNEAFKEVHNIRRIMLLTTILTIVVAVFLWIFLRRLTRPLYELVSVMSKVKEDNLEVYAKENGTSEVRLLSSTYNQMMKSINEYIQKIYLVEKEKRKAEIHALQMQIEPHYMYNTLASIKFLVWQNDSEKATQMIDAFIGLLRNTIGSVNEFIPLKEDIKNLENYVFINQVRYGTDIHVDYFIAPDCEFCMVPKLILQPFVENAFFHAFPEGRGYIRVFAKREDTYLKIEIKDNGIGISQEKVQAFNENKEVKREHFTGIGINNVDDRIKLLYGSDCGITIESEEEKGTSICMKLPIEEANKGES